MRCIQRTEFTAFAIDGRAYAAGVTAGMATTDTDSVALLQRGEQFAALVRYADLISGATERLFLMDPYVGRETLALLSYASAGVRVHVLTSERGYSPAFRREWAAWSADHAGESECRSVAHREAPHDRFLFVDERLYLSGSSLKGVGQKLSMLVQIGDPELVAQVETSLADNWNNAALLGAD